jgi:hypothetical protein
MKPRSQQLREWCLCSKILHWYKKDELEGEKADAKTSKSTF